MAACWRLTVVLATIPVALAARSADAQLASCKVGDQVAMQVGYEGKWLPAVVVAVDSSKPFPCRVHPTGYASTMDQYFHPSMLKPASAASAPPAGKPQQAAAPAPPPAPPPAAAPGGPPVGSYQCYHLGAPRQGLNFTIVDGTRYKDWSGTGGTYSFAGGTLQFRGAGLDGLRAAYAPSRGRYTATFDVTGDSCDLRR